MVYRFSDGYQDRLPELAEKIIALTQSSWGRHRRCRGKKGGVDDPDRSAARRRRSSGLDSERGPARVTSQDRTMRGGIAAVMELAREIVRGQTVVAHQCKGPKAAPGLKG
jgi:hypothetical protein